MTDYVVRQEHDGVYLDIDGAARLVDTVHIHRALGQPTRLEVVYLSGRKAETELDFGDTLRIAGWDSAADAHPAGGKTET